MNKIENIYVLGGTHGNEFTGAYIVNNWNIIFPKNILNSTINIIPILANKKAFLERKRYIDRDLNRSFFLKDLNNIDLSNYEDNRAKVINILIGPKKDNSNFIIDLHTTNASMGITLMTSKKDIYKLNLIKYISNKIKDINVIFTDDENNDRPFLNSISKNNLLIELGAISNNTLNHDVFDDMKNIILLAIEFLNKIKDGSLILDEKISVPAFEIIKKVKFPMDINGNINGIIHKDIQGQDYRKKINKESNIFILFDGTIVKLNEDEEYYMSFINESAYYIENTAFYLMKKINLSLN